MTQSKLITAQAAAAYIPNRATIAVNSSSGLNCPDALLQAIGERFAATGAPRNLTTIHPIAAGDMYGVKGIDHIAQAGLLARVIAGSYPSGPSSMESPRIWQMIDNDEIEAYNLPSGLIFHQLREAAAKRPGVLTQVGLDTFVDPRRQGGRMNRRTTEEIVQVVDFDGQEWLYLRALRPDVALIRATSADARGNLSFEHEGAFLGAYDVALAAHNSGGIVIAQVKRLVAADSLPAQSVRVPGILVDHIVLAPEQRQTTQTDYDPAISGEVRVPAEGFAGAEWGVEKVIARRAAMELHDGEAVNLGFGISALVPRILHEEGLDGSVTWVIEQGAVGGMPLLGFQFGCAANAQAIIPSPDQFSYFQGGGFDRSFLSFMEIDREGNVNVSRLRSRPHVTAGVGGFIDITAHAKRIVLSGTFTTAGSRIDVCEGKLCIDKEGKVHKFVNEVEHVTFSGRRARQTGQEVVVVTERCVLRLETDGWCVIEIAPGVDLQRDVLAQCDFPLAVADNLREMDARLFVPELMGLCLQEVIE
ncbi:MAG: acyl CoA:acetate/3-ketoacid CoA transferase [Caldilineaceae bacterium]|nr:acyl CoA:acetate/3-ketoacid CoA transferase [Caldilineaceae bacterium]